jgi:hypothetical protein
MSCLSRDVGYTPTRHSQDSEQKHQAASLLGYGCRGEGWDSDPIQVLIPRKLLISRSSQSSKTSTTTELRYTAGTRAVPVLNPVLGTCANLDPCHVGHRPCTDDSLQKQASGRSGSLYFRGKIEGWQSSRRAAKKQVDASPVNKAHGVLTAFAGNGRPA